MGKTELLEELELPLEVINADSMQVYRGLDIGTAKPAPALLRRIPHHLINVCEPSEQFHVGRFVEEANRLIPEIEGRGSLPVVSGGTAFYFKNLLYGLPDTPEATEESRRAIREELSEKGLPALYERLRRIDPESAERIEPRDEYRILRALEVFRDSGRPRSAFREPTEPREDLDFRALGLYRDRQGLYDRINRRVDQMFAAGLPEEVGRLVRSGVDAGAPAMRGIGYKEFFASASVEELAAEGLTDEQRRRIEGDVKKNSRRYAKRQITFFSRLPDVTWLEAGEEGELRRSATELFEET